MTDELTKLEIHPTLQEIADRIRERIARTAHEIGQELLAAKALCEHGEWSGFLLVAGIAPRTAQDMMAFASKVDDPKYANLAHLQHSRFLIEAREIDKQYTKDAQIEDLENICAALKEQIRGLVEQQEKLKAMLRFNENPEELQNQIKTAKKQEKNWMEKFTEEKNIGYGLRKRLKKLESSAA